MATLLTKLSVSKPLTIAEFTEVCKATAITNTPLRSQRVNMNRLEVVSEIQLSGIKT